MSKKFIRALLAIGCLTPLILCARAEADQGIAGTYVHVGDVAATMIVHVSKGVADISLEGGGRRSAGASSAADCGIRAIGPVAPSGVVASFRALQTDTMDYDQALAIREQRKIRITFSPREAQVVSADIEGYCGVGAQFDGRYKRR
jgi:hypothetical protein